MNCVSFKVAFGAGCVEDFGLQIVLKILDYTDCSLPERIAATKPL